MAINFPAALDGTAQFSQPTGASLLTGIDHAAQHDNLSSFGTIIEAVLGTTAGTSVLKNFAAGDFPARQQGGTFQAVYTGILNLFGQGTNSGTQQGGVYGTATWQGGTINNTVMGTPAITGGTYNAGVLGSPTIGSITVPGTINALGFSAAIAPGVGTIIDVAGGTLTVNAQTAQIFYSAQGTSAGNRTIATPLNPSPYQQLTYAFKSSGSANGTLVWGTAFRISVDAGTPTIGTGTSWNYFSWRYNLIDTKWDFQGQVGNLI